MPHDTPHALVYDAAWIMHFDMPISTDDIIAGTRKHSSTDPAELAQYVFENIDPTLAASFRPRGALISSKIFGIGSSREQAVIALKAAGVILILAPEFGRIFYRNCWNNGLPALYYTPQPGGKEARVCFDAHHSRLVIDGRAVPIPPLNPLQLKLLHHGSLPEILRCQLLNSTA